MLLKIIQPVAVFIIIIILNVAMSQCQVQQQPLTSAFAQTQVQQAGQVPFPYSAYPNYNTAYAPYTNYGQYYYPYNYNNNYGYEQYGQYGTPAVTYNNNNGYGGYNNGNNNGYNYGYGYGPPQYAQIQGVKDGSVPIIMEPLVGPVPVPVVEEVPVTNNNRNPYGGHYEIYEYGRNEFPRGIDAAAAESDARREE